MTETVSDLDVSEIEDRADAATAGPWGVALGDTIATGVEEVDAHGYRFDQMIAHLDDLDYERDDGTKDVEQLEIDAAFIAHARDDVPALVDEVRRLRAEVVEAEQVTAEFGSLLNELARTEGDLGVAIREAAAAREALQAAQPFVEMRCIGAGVDSRPRHVLALIDAALDQRLTQ